MGIDYERWDLSRVAGDYPADAVLAGYAEEIDELKRAGSTPSARWPLGAMLLAPHSKGLQIAGVQHANGQIGSLALGFL
jgi:hypothetical protein